MDASTSISPEMGVDWEEMLEGIILGWDIFWLLDGLEIIDSLD